MYHFHRIYGDDLRQSDNRRNKRSLPGSRAARWDQKKKGPFEGGQATFLEFNSTSLRSLHSLISHLKCAPLSLESLLYRSLLAE